MRFKLSGTRHDSTSFSLHFPFTETTFPTEVCVNKHLKVDLEKVQWVGGRKQTHGEGGMNSQKAQGLQ